MGQIGCERPGSRALGRRVLEDRAPGGICRQSDWKSRWQGRPFCGGL